MRRVMKIEDMRLKLIFSLAIGALICLATLVNGANLNEPPPGFIALFNGKDLNGWWGCGTEDPRKWMNLPPAELERKRKESLKDIQKHWRVENGELVNDGEGLYLTTERYFRDFELLIDYKTVPKADSGIYLKGCPQVQIWDYTKEGGKWELGADKGSGGLWNNSPGSPGKDPLVLADRPFGEWNHFRIVQVGARTWVWLNEQLVVNGAIMENYFDRSRPIPPKGPIQLQTHGGEIRWRNIFIREIGPEEAILWLRGTSDPRDFKKIFNGKDLEGWRGDVDGYEVIDGKLRCKPTSGGTIYYDEEYCDFIARVEFKLPPAGNNGLAIRYPGHGDSAYVGMCEVQILDDYASEYARLDPRQYCGSIYGMVAAERGYLRGAGEWNYMEVTVKGSHILVELNGAIIVNADISKVKEFMDNRPHPGKDRKCGFFGLAGHHSPVEFRNIAIKRLN